MSTPNLIFLVVGGALGLLFYFLERRNATLKEKLAETTVDKNVAAQTEKVEESRTDSIKKLEDYRDKKAKYDAISNRNNGGSDAS